MYPGLSRGIYSRCQSSLTLIDPPLKVTSVYPSPFQIRGILLRLHAVFSPCSRCDYSTNFLRIEDIAYLADLFKMSGYQSSSDADGFESGKVRSTIHSVQKVMNSGPAMSGGVSQPPSLGGFAPMGSARPPVSDVGADDVSLPLELEAGGEEGELADEPLDSAVEPFVFDRRHVPFAAGFRRCAVPAAAYCGFEMPPPVIKTDGELPSGDPYGDMEAPVELRYPAARSHLEAFQRPLLSASARPLVACLGNKKEASLVPCFDQLRVDGVPRIEQVMASFLTDRNIVQSVAPDGRNLPVAFSKQLPVHEAARSFADHAWKAAAQIAALNSSVALLSTAVEIMARRGATPTESGDPPQGLSPVQCQAVYDHMRLCNAAMLSVSQTAGSIAASAAVVTRQAWLSFVDFKSVGKQPNVAKFAQIVNAPVGTTGLFGTGLEEILSRQEAVTAQLPALQAVLKRKEGSSRRHATSSRGGEGSSTRRRSPAPRGGDVASSSRQEGPAGRQRQRGRGRGYNRAPQYDRYPQQPYGAAPYDGGAVGRGRGRQQRRDDRPAPYYGHTPYTAPAAPPAGPSYPRD